jgi:hypothetical protein
MGETRQSSFDVADMLRGLASAEAGVPGWLEQSWQHPEPFHRALHAYVGASSPKPLKGRPFEGQDFYHDVVVRHLGHRREALVFHEPGLGWRGLTYEELHARSSALLPTWEAAGVQAGQTVTLVLPVCEELAVALLTALRLGLVLSVLPPRGATFLRHRLEALAPDHVVSHPRYTPLLGELGQQLLSLRPSEDASEPTFRSHTYEPGAPIARLFSPLSPTPELPVEVLAGPFFLGLLRDAVLVLALWTSDRVALPGYDLVQFQPYALLMTWLAGACFLEVDEQGLTDAQAQERLAPTVVGTTPTLRERVLEGQVRTDDWRLWLRNPAEPYDWERWDVFTEHLASNKRCRGMNWLANAAFCGSLFFTSLQVRPTHLAILPAPGLPWQLADLLGGGQPSHAESGLYALTGDGADEATFGRFLLSHTREGYFFAGSTRLGANGQTYPVAEVVEVVAAHPDVKGTSVVITPASQQLNRTVVTLLVFVDPAWEPSSMARELRPALERLIDLELGARYRPHAVCFYPLLPRRKEDGAVDHDWCRWQFLSGTLDRKGKDELFRMLGQVRQLLSQAQARTGA